MTLFKRICGTAFLLLLVVLASCARNPVDGSPDLVLMSEKQEIELGRVLHPRILQETQPYANAELQAYVNDLGQRLAAVSERENLTYTFTVLDDTMVNAFALPGGYIYITRGMLMHLNSEAELAAVLAHEIGHVTGRHSVKRDASNKLLSGLGAAASIASGTSLANSATNAIGGAVISGYGRSQELEADEFGARYMALAGYSPEAMLGTIDLLKKRELFEIERARIEKREANVPHGLYQTHPDNDKRFEEAVLAARGLVPEAPIGDQAERYLNQINGLLWGETGAPGTMRRDYFYNGKYNIKLKFPDNWRLDGKSSQVVAFSPDKDAAMQVFVLQPGRTMTPEQALMRKFGINKFREGREITVSGMRAFIGITDRYESPFGPRPARMAAIFDERIRRGYLFVGTGRNDLSKLAADQEFIATIFSFDKIKADEQSLANPPRLKVVTAEADTSIEMLARQSALPEYQHQLIRLMNGLYPDLEPTPGQLIKTVD